MMGGWKIRGCENMRSARKWYWWRWAVEIQVAPMVTVMGGERVRVGEGCYLDSNPNPMFR